jgi:hypothetical protein
MVPITIFDCVPIGCGPSLKLGVKWTECLILSVFAVLPGRHDRFHISSYSGVLKKLWEGWNVACVGHGSSSAVRGQSVNIGNKMQQNGKKLP